MRQQQHQLELFLTAVICCSLSQGLLVIQDSPRRVVKTLSVRNGGIWGDWGDREFCAEGTFAAGYDMKIEPYQQQGDDSQLNAIKLRCERPGDDTVRGDVTSTQGQWGSWVGVTRCDYDRYYAGRHFMTAFARHFMTAFALQVEAGQGNGDDTTANYIKFKCRDLASYTHAYELAHQPGHGAYGTYGYFSESCPRNSAICGIRTRVEVHQGRGDDTALNDVEMYCCET